MYSAGIKRTLSIPADTSVSDVFAFAAYSRSKSNISRSNLNISSAGMSMEHAYSICEPSLISNSGDPLIRPMEINRSPACEAWRRSECNCFFTIFSLNYSGEELPHAFLDAMQDHRMCIRWPLRISVTGFLCCIYCDACRLLKGHSRAWRQYYYPLNEWPAIAQSHTRSRIPLISL